MGSWNHAANRTVFICCEPKSGFAASSRTAQTNPGFRHPGPRGKMPIMSLTISSDPAPLVADENGVVRIRGSRVRLDTVIYAFNQGATAEEILQQYPSLGLSEIYATIGYYLQHRDSVDAYLQERGREHDRVRQLNESRTDPAGLRERLLKRQPPPRV
jgi:uncharacterized protein (DUF433 family)